MNLFVPSEVAWQYKGMPVKLIQATNFPESEFTELRLELPSAAEFTLNVRIPGWLQAPAEIRVNHAPASVEAKPRTFAAIRRRWENNDTVQIKLPMAFSTASIDDQHRDIVALMRGPVMLVALDPSVEVPQKVLGSLDSFKPTGQVPGSFELPAPNAKLRFVPFYTVGDETYTTYFARV